MGASQAPEAGRIAYPREKSDSDPPSSPRPMALQSKTSGTSMGRRLPVERSAERRSEGWTRIGGGQGRQLQAEGGVTGWTTLPHSCTCTVITIFSFYHESVPPTRCIPLSRTFLPNSDLSRKIPRTYLSWPPCMRSALPLERAMTIHM
jgi:hypothetical protein